jgi:hypothetical protein
MVLASAFPASTCPESLGTRPPDYCEFHAGVVAKSDVRYEPSVGRTSSEMSASGATYLARSAPIAKDAPPFAVTICIQPANARPKRRQSTTDMIVRNRLPIINVAVIPPVLVMVHKPEAAALGASLLTTRFALASRLRFCWGLGADGPRHITRRAAVASVHTLPRKRLRQPDSWCHDPHATACRGRHRLEAEVRAERPQGRPRIRIRPP